MPPEKSRNRSRITSLAMIGLISTPSTRRAPKTSAESEIAAAAGADDERREPEVRAGRVDPARPVLEVIGERRELVAQVLRVRQVRRRRCRIGVDAAESMSMNRVSGSGPL